MDTFDLRTHYELACSTFLKNLEQTNSATDPADELITKLNMIEAKLPLLQFLPKLKEAVTQIAQTVEQLKANLSKEPSTSTLEKTIELNKQLQETQMRPLHNSACLEKIDYFDEISHSSEPA